jgi:hypothetical protein
MYVTTLYMRFFLQSLLRLLAPFFLQLSAFTGLPVMKRGRGTPGELMNASIATQSFGYEILPDVWPCTLLESHNLLLYQRSLFRWSCSVVLFHPVDFLL